MSETDIIRRLEEIKLLKEKYYNVRMAALELQSWIVPTPEINNPEKGKVLTLFKKGFSQI